MHINTEWMNGALWVDYAKIMFIFTIIPSLIGRIHLSRLFFLLQMKDASFSHVQF